MNKSEEVVTIQTRYGDTYECVDFYKQPAFAHPLLKNYKFNFKMNFSFQDSVGRTTDSRSLIGSKLSDIWLNGKGCPIGMVPIKRITENDSLQPNLVTGVILNPGVHVAVLHTTGGQLYYGGGMFTSVYNPVVKDNQYSSSRIKLQNGPDSIAAGWVVNPSLYQDNQTRLFIYTTTKDSRCYNTFCPGFVLMSHNIPIDLVLNPVSKRGGNIYGENFFIRKDPENGDWYLRVGSNNILGVRPKKIFTSLASFANYAEWGGEVYSPPGTTPPPMGSGYLPVGSAKQDGYAKLISTVNENNLINYDPSGCDTYADSDRYKVIDEGNVGAYFQRLVFFGGNSF
ncbi:unnamed protein product [Linum trigynum]